MVSEDVVAAWVRQQRLEGPASSTPADTSEPVIPLSPPSTPQCADSPAQAEGEVFDSGTESGEDAMTTRSSNHSQSDLTSFMANLKLTLDLGHQSNESTPVSPSSHQLPDQLPVTASPVVPDFLTQVDSVLNRLKVSLTGAEKETGAAAAAGPTEDVTAQVLHQYIASGALNQHQQSELIGLINRLQSSLHDLHQTGPAEAPSPGPPPPPPPLPLDALYQSKAVGWRAEFLKTPAAAPVTHRPVWCRRGSQQQPEPTRTGSSTAEKNAAARVLVETPGLRGRFIQQPLRPAPKITAKPAAPIKLPPHLLSSKSCKTPTAKAVDHERKSHQSTDKCKKSSSKTAPASSESSGTSRKSTRAAGSVPWKVKLAKKKAERSQTVLMDGTVSIDIRKSLHQAALRKSMEDLGPTEFPAPAAMVQSQVAYPIVKQKSLGELYAPRPVPFGPWGRAEASGGSPPAKRDYCLPQKPKPFRRGNTVIGFFPSRQKDQDQSPPVVSTLRWTPNQVDPLGTFSSSMTIPLQLDPEQDQEVTRPVQAPNQRQEAVSKAEDQLQLVVAQEVEDAAPVPVEDCTKVSINIEDTFVISTTNLSDDINCILHHDSGISESTTPDPVVMKSEPPPPQGSHVVVEDPSQTLFTASESIQIAIHKAAINKQISEEEARRRDTNKVSTPPLTPPFELVPIPNSGFIPAETAETAESAETAETAETIKTPSATIKLVPIPNSGFIEAETIKTPSATIELVPILNSESIRAETIKTPPLELVPIPNFGFIQAETIKTPSAPIELVPILNSGFIRTETIKTPPLELVPIPNPGFIQAETIKTPSATIELVSIPNSGLIRTETIKTPPLELVPIPNSVSIRTKTIETPSATIELVPVTNCGFKVAPTLPVESMKTPALELVPPKNCGFKAVLPLLAAIPAEFVPITNSGSNPHIFKKKIQENWNKERSRRSNTVALTAPTEPAPCGTKMRSQNAVIPGAFQVKTENDRKFQSFFSQHQTEEVNPLVNRRVLLPIASEPPGGSGMKWTNKFTNIRSAFESSKADEDTSSPVRSRRTSGEDSTSSSLVTTANLRVQLNSGNISVACRSPKPLGQSLLRGFNQQLPSSPDPSPVPGPSQEPTKTLSKSSAARESFLSKNPAPMVFQQQGPSPGTFTRPRLVQGTSLHASAAGPRPLRKDFSCSSIWTDFKDDKEDEEEDYGDDEASSSSCSSDDEDQPAHSIPSSVANSRSSSSGINRLSKLIKKYSSTEDLNKETALPVRQLGSTTPVSTGKIANWTGASSSGVFKSLSNQFIAAGDWRRRSDDMANIELLSVTPPPPIPPRPRDGPTARPQTLCGLKSAAYVEPTGATLVGLVARNVRTSHNSNSIANSALTFADSTSFHSSNATNDHSPTSIIMKSVSSSRIVTEAKELLSKRPDFLSSPGSGQHHRSRPQSLIVPSDAPVAAGLIRRSSARVVGNKQYEASMSPESAEKKQREMLKFFSSSAADTSSTSPSLSKTSRAVPVQMRFRAKSVAPSAALRPRTVTDDGASLGLPSAPDELTSDVDELFDRLLASDSLADARNASDPAPQASSHLTKAKFLDRRRVWEQSTKLHLNESISLSSE